MSAFLDALRAVAPASASGRGDGRRWLFVPYDQLTDAVGPLAREAPKALGIVLVETLWKPRQRADHKQKLALVLASMRHFALEQARRGVAVRYVVGEASYSACLEPIVAELGPLCMMEAAEHELRVDLRPLVEAGRLEVVPNETWLTTRAQFERACPPQGPWRMDRFYAQVRRDTGILMQDGRPEGGRFSFDGENRRRWKGDPPAPIAPCFPIDPIKQEVVELVERRFAEHPGRLDPDALPATRDDAESLWRFARDACLPCFGPYEDAMSTRSATLFHTRLSALLNNGRLLPRRVVEEAAGLPIAIASREGFVRQILGWREFMRHVHVETNGLRDLPPGWVFNPLGADAPLPPAFWGRPSGLHCLDRVVEEVWSTGYGHHITRLMVLSNVATLLGVDPRALSDWFWIAYVDAYDWVVESNVLGMGTYALGDLFVTKPYVSGAAYLHRMSDYCDDCDFAPERDCPLTALYWDFLARNEPVLRDNPRLAMPYRSLARRDRARREWDRAIRTRVAAMLARGERIGPAALRAREDEPAAKGGADRGRRSGPRSARRRG